MGQEQGTEWERDTVIPVLLHQEGDFISCGLHNFPILTSEPERERCPAVIMTARKESGKGDVKSGMI